MWIPYNPNPLGITTVDCTVRAICAVTGKSWDEIFREQCELAWKMADMPSADRVWWTLLEQIGFGQQRMFDRCPDCYTVEDFCYDHRSGLYILGPREHAVAVINGEYWDSWDSGQTIPAYFFKRR